MKATGSSRQQRSATRRTRFTGGNVLTQRTLPESRAAIVVPNEGGVMSAPEVVTGLVVASLGEGAVAYNPRTGGVHHLDPVAALIVPHLDGSTRLDDLVAEVAESFDVPIDEARAGLDSLTRSLARQGLLVDVPGDAEFAERQRSGDGRRDVVTTSPTDARQGGPRLADASWDSGIRRALELDVRVRLVGGDAAAAAALAALVEHFPPRDRPADRQADYVVREHVGHPEHRWTLHRRDQRLFWGAGFDGALSTLVRDINAEVTRACSPRMTVLHAAAVERDGVAVLLPAPMESGKTTLAAALVQHGYGYLTDEVVGLLLPGHASPVGEVVGLAKPFGFDPGTWPLFPDAQPDFAEPDWAQWPVSADLLRPGSVVRLARTGQVVLPRYRPGSAGALVRIDGWEAFRELVMCTFDFSSHAERDVPVLAALVRNVPIHRLEVDDLAAAVGAVDLVMGAAVAPHALRRKPAADG